jgi:death-on-curing protein
VIAERVLDIPAERLIHFERLVALAESALHVPRTDYFGTEVYPDFETKAGVLCSRLIRNHPLPDGNKRVAYLCLTEFVERNGRSWDASEPDEVVDVLEAVAARGMSEEEFLAWVANRIST